MVSDHPSCSKSRISKKAWNEYMKGASAVFVYQISKGERVTVLAPPPPDQFHPDGATNYQAIEEPILKGSIEGSVVSRIEMVHPTVKGAKDFCYEVWPADETHLWNARFGMLPRKPNWRRVSPKMKNLMVTQVEMFIQTEAKPRKASKTEKALRKEKRRKKKRRNRKGKSEKTERRKEEKEAGSASHENSSGIGLLEEYM
jgi:hypothetical protein